METNERGLSKRRGRRDLHGPCSSPIANSWKRFASRWNYLITNEAFRSAPVLTLSRLVSWRVRCLLRRGGIARLAALDVNLFVPPNWRGVEKLIFAFREHYEHELHYLAQILSPGQTFVDAGACYGIYTLTASKIAGPKGRVIAFEPASRAFRILARNIQLNGLTNVLACPLALTEKQGKARLYHHPNVGCDSLGRDHSFTEAAEEIATDTLDNVLRKLSVEQVDVLKMDVQGAEELVLRGATATLGSHHPLVIFELYPEGTRALGLSPYGAWELLASLGYEFFVMTEDGELRSEREPRPGICNVVGIYGK